MLAPRHACLHLLKLLDRLEVADKSRYQKVGTSPCTVRLTGVKELLAPHWHIPGSVASPVRATVDDKPNILGGKLAAVTSGKSREIGHWNLDMRRHWAIAPTLDAVATGTELHVQFDTGAPFQLTQMTRRGARCEEYRCKQQRHDVQASC